MTSEKDTNLVLKNLNDRLKKLEEYMFRQLEVSFNPFVCHNCGKALKKLSEYNYEYVCDCYKKKIRLSIG